MARPKKTERKDGYRVGLLWLRDVDGKRFYYVDEYVKLDNTDKPKRVRRSTGVEEGDYDRAMRRRDDIVAEERKGLENKGRVPTFAEWIPIYRSTWEKRKRSGQPIAQNTIESHDASLQVLKAYFGDMRMDRIGPTECMGFYNDRQTHAPLNGHGQPRRCEKCNTLDVEKRPDRATCKGCQALRVTLNTVHKDCQFAQAVFQAAFDAGIITKNPWKGTRLSFGIGARPTGRSLTLDEQDRFLAAATPDIQRFVRLTVGLGLRVGAVRALPMPEQVEWLEAEYLGRKLKFPVVRVWSKGKIVETGIRPDLWELYTEQARYMQQERERRGKKPSPTIFKWSVSGLYSKIARTCEDAGIPYFTPHDLRRTFATTLDEQGVPEETISKLLHQVNPNVARRHYIKGEVDKRRLMQRYVALLGAGGGA